MYLIPFIYLGLCVGTPLLAWDAHWLITQFALEKTQIVSQSVTYFPLDRLLMETDLGLALKDEKSFRTVLKINKKKNPFQMRLKETTGKVFSAFKVVSVYADEPDWGMDQGLFSEDEYPELWKEDTKYVSKKTGLGSQGFRHQYYPGNFDWKRPIESFQIPQHALGEAPERSALFLKLSQNAFQAGHPYWGYRFLGWSLHYIEDLFQPFHSCQTPSKHFIQFKWKWFLFPKIDIAASAEVLSYYHLGYELWVKREMGRKQTPLLEALQNGNRLENFNPLDPYSTKERVVTFSNLKAASLGREVKSHFPQFHWSEGQKGANETINDIEWITKVPKGDKLTKLERITFEIFKSLGATIRQFVAIATNEAL